MFPVRDELKFCMFSRRTAVSKGLTHTYTYSLTFSVFLDFKMAFYRSSIIMLIDPTKIFQKDLKFCFVLPLSEQFLLFCLPVIMIIGEFIKTPLSEICCGLPKFC
jgi:hypothetical protein